MGGGAPATERDGCPSMGECRAGMFGWIGRLGERGRVRVFSGGGG